MTAVRELIAYGRKLDERGRELDELRADVARRDERLEAMAARTRAGRCACGVTAPVCQGTVLRHDDPSGHDCILGGEAWLDVARVAIAAVPA